MPLLVVYNPICGHGTAKALFDDTVVPLLRQHGREPDRVEETTHAGHAGEIVVDFLKSTSGPVEIVLGSGDGTLHEIVCSLHSAPGSADHRQISIALVPCGTANALYASLFPPSSPDEDPAADKLKSLHTLLNDASATRPLTLAITNIVAKDAKVVRSSTSAVVASTSLHASILHDSEALRATHPGIERFKMAAQQNITRWYHAKVRLLPPCSIYRAAEDRFVAYEGGELDGPFAYFLSTVNVDRLEPFFRITPLHTAIPPAKTDSPTLDIVVIRPLRDRSIQGESESSQEAFSRKTVAALGGAYQDGAHAKLVYGDNGEVGPLSSLKGEQSEVVEYFRCGGWEWVPNKADDAAHLVCVDGEILHVESGGKACCKAVDAIDGFALLVHA